MMNSNAVSIKKLKSKKAVSILEEDDAGMTNADTLVTKDNTSSINVDALSAYLNNNLKAALLTATDEVLLSKAIKAGNTPSASKKVKAAGLRARETVILANLRLVVNVARKYKNLNVPFEDLISEGNIGLMTAINKFDHTKGFRFSTYAHWWIKQNVQRAVNDMKNTVRWPVHFSDLHRKYLRYMMTNDKKGIVPTLEMIMKNLEINKEQADMVININSVTVSLDKSVSIGGGEDGAPLVETLISRQSEQESKNFANDESKAVLEMLMHKHLIKRDIVVLKLRYGLGSYSPKTLEQVGDIVGLTRERIRQIECNGIHKLKQVMVKNGMKIGEFL
jgi:RNA polymerase sigma factor (sigma-70 family)